jgi:hypothetical protein
MEIWDLNMKARRFGILWSGNIFRLFHDDVLFVYGFFFDSTGCHLGRALSSAWKISFRMWLLKGSGRVLVPDRKGASSTILCDTNEMNVIDQGNRSGQVTAKASRILISRYQVGSDVTTSHAYRLQISTR